MLKEFFWIEWASQRMSNNINGPSLNFIYINVFIYAFIALLIILFRHKKILTILFIIWLALEFRAWHTYLQYAKQDFLLANMTLDEKREVLSPPDLYRNALKKMPWDGDNPFYDIRNKYYQWP